MKVLCLSMDGLLAIDKPAGPTSHDVVARVRRATNWTSVGHTGTLDPMATGVLALVVGRATRLVRLLTTDKEYEAEVRLGWATDTYDATGTPIDITGLKPCATAADLHRSCTSSLEVQEQPVSPACVWPPAEDLRPILDRFLGTYPQAPPPYSAKKIAGVRAYALARKGRQVEPSAAMVTVHHLTVLDQQGDRLKVRIHCAGGFYVRSFAHELGKAVGIGAHLSALCRTAVGDVRLADAVRLDAVEADPALAAARLTPMSALVEHIPAVVVTDSGATRVRHGNDVRPVDCRSISTPATTGRVRLVDERGTLLAIGEPGAQPGILRPRVVVV